MKANDKKETDVVIAIEQHRSGEYISYISSIHGYKCLDRNIKGYKVGDKIKR